MTSSPDNTVMQLLADLYSQAYAGGAVGKDVTRYILEAKQSLDSHYLSIFLEELENTVIFLKNDLPSLLSVDEVVRIRKQHKDELRTALQDRLGGKS